jgi:hypothetical protein
MRNKFPLYFLIVLVSFLTACVVVKPAPIQSPAPIKTTPAQTTQPQSKPQSAQTITPQKPPDPPTIVLFEATPTELAAGQSATLAWKVTGATSVEINQSVGAVQAEGSASIVPAERTVYILTAHNLGSIASKDVTVIVNKNLQAKPCALKEEDVIPYNFTFNSNSNPTMKGTISTYYILFHRQRTIEQFIDNRISVYATGAEAAADFNQDKYNNRMFSPVFKNIGGQGYVINNKGADPSEPDTYLLYFIKNNVYAKLTGNIDMQEMDIFSRLVESRIQ